MKYATLCALVMLAFAGCGGEPRAPEEIVAERAQARWDALIERDFELARSYYSPGFRAQNTASGFASAMQGRPVRWDDARVDMVDCSRDKCTVKVNVTYTAIAAPGHLADMQNTRPLNETWIELDSEWWYSYQE